MMSFAPKPKQNALQSIDWGADGPNRLYGQDVSDLGPAWQQINGGSNLDPRIGSTNIAQGQTADGYKALGFSGDVMIPAPYNPDGNVERDGGQMVVNPAFTQWLAQNQYTPVSASDASGHTAALRDAQGNIVPGSVRKFGDGADDAFGAAVLAAAAIMTGGVAAAGGAGGTGSAALGGSVASSGAPTVASLAGANGTIGGATSQAAMFGQSLGAADAAAGVGGTGLVASPGAGLTLAGATGTGAGLATGTGAGVLGAGLGDALAAGGGLSAAQLASYAGPASTFTPGAYSDPYANMPTTSAVKPPMPADASWLDNVLEFAKTNPSLLTAGAGLLSGAIQNNSVGKALDAQSASTAAALAEQRRQFDLTRGDFAPYRAAGTTALGQLATENNTLPTPEEVMSDPGYKFGLDQGQQALDRKAAAAGGRISGASLKGAAQYGTDYATAGYDKAYGRRNDRLNRLAALAGIGQTATSNTAQAGSNSTNAISGLLTNQGDSNAAATLARGNIWGNTTNQIGAVGNQWATGGYSGPYSDARLKTNIRRIGTTPRGNAWYEWDWKTGGSAEGVIAQEVAHIHGAVHEDRDGLLMVDYSKV